MNAGIDSNERNTIILASKDDGETIVAPTASPVTHRISTTMITGTDNGNNQGNALIDDNGRSAWTALSSDGSGQIIEVYADPITKALLIQ